MVGADAEHHRGAHGGRRRDGEREQGLADGDADTGLDRLPAPRPETLQLVVFPLKRGDHRQHGDSVVHDRKAVGLQPLDLQQARLDVRRVVRDRPVQNRHDGDREQRQQGIDAKRDPDHADDRQARLHERLQRHDQAARGCRLEIDAVHQPADTDLIAIRDGEPLGVAKQIAAEVDDDHLFEFRVHVGVHDVQHAAGDRDGEGRDDRQRENSELSVGSAEDGGRDRRQRGVTNHVVDEDLQRPRRQKTDQRGGHHEER